MRVVYDIQAINVRLKNEVFEMITKYTERNA